MYAWIIDTDHLADEERKTTGKVEDDAKGTLGPGAAPEWMCELLQGGVTPANAATMAGRVTGRDKGGDVEVFRFKMSDDDGIRYYSGRMITDEGTTEDACYGPLGDFGSPNAGCTSIEYHGHPEMNCG